MGFARLVVIESPFAAKREGKTVVRCKAAMSPNPCLLEHGHNGNHKCGPLPRCTCVSYGSRCDTCSGLIWIETSSVRLNVEYARRCLLDSLNRGEYPFASHLLYTQALDDANVTERALGMAAGFAWGERAQLTAVYTDRGISEGMRAGIRAAELANRPVEYRTIGL